jgi:GNAT superfamily N-acetyltransferase
MIPGEDHLLIENVAVRPDQQGKGLVHHAEGIARSLGFKEIHLYTNSVFASNLAFYSRRGYQNYRRRTIVPGSIAVFMKKQLTP